MTKVAINGFGRIGRLVARAILERPDCGLELVAINDLADAKSNAMLFKRDSVHGPFPGEISYDESSFTVNGKRIQVTAERDPAKLPHKELGVEIALFEGAKDDSRGLQDRSRARGVHRHGSRPSALG